MHHHKLRRDKGGSFHFILAVYMKVFIFSPGWPGLGFLSKGSRLLTLCSDLCWGYCCTPLALQDGPVVL